MAFPVLSRETLSALNLPRVARRGGRQTVLDATFGSIGRFGDRHEIQRWDPSQSWKTLDTQRREFLRLPFSRLLRYALDLSPELGKALDDFQRFCNPGHRTENDSGSRALNGTLEFQAQVGKYHSSWTNHLDLMFSSIFTVGALFVELVLDEAGVVPLDIVINDPASVVYRLETAGARGQIYALYQRQGVGDHKRLEDNPLIRYIPFGSLVGEPYGRPLMSGGVYSSMILLGILRDTQRAIANAGLSRIDYSLELEQMLQLIDRNPDIAGDDVATAQFISEQIETIRRVLEGLDVDDNFVHLSTVEVNYASNPIQTNYSGITEVLQALRREIATGAKTYSVLMNINDSVADTYAIRQMEAFVSNVAAVQQEVAGVLNYYFDVANRVQGIRSASRFQFLKQRVRDVKDVAETERIEIENITVAEQNGWITSEEAAERYRELRDPLIV